MTRINQTTWTELYQQCIYRFPDLEKIDPQIDDLITVGGDLSASTLIYAYASGYFPMHMNDQNLTHLASGEKVVGWFSPKTRAIFKPGLLRVTRSMKQSFKKYECRIDTCFREMIEMCKTAPRPLGWIDNEFVERYMRLHELGFAHSVEVFLDDELIGGLYGVGFGGFFAGESMVHKKRDASKVAMMHLNLLAQELGLDLIDSQWMTEHLKTLGAIEVPRLKYIELLKTSLGNTEVAWPVGKRLV